MARKRRPSDGTWTVSKTAVATASSVLAIVALAALAVVASIKNADALATVALSLALLSFVLQILMFIVQTYATNDQMLKAQQLYAQMADALSEIKTRAETTQHTVEKVSDRVVEALIRKAAAESGEEVEVPSDVARRVREVLAPEPTEAPRRPHGYPPPAPDAAVVRLLSTWPSEEEAGPLIAILNELNTWEHADLARLGADEIRSRHPDSPFGPGLFGAYEEGLIDRGLVEVDDGYTNESGSPLNRLTDAGRQVTRLFTPPPPPPAYLEKFVETHVEPVYRRVPKNLRPPGWDDVAYEGPRAT